MAPKRKSTDAAGDSASKKSKATADNAPAAPALPPVPRSKRWSKGVSGSANADMEYRTMMARNPGSAWEFVCQCRPIADADDDDDDEEDEDEAGEGEGEGEPKKKSDRPPCDHGKTCLCTKPSAEHPEHPYTLTLGGIQKFSTTAILCSLRDPDAFDMYIYNDFYGYGLLEVVGNLLLDFEEVKNDWKQQWFICEAMVVFFHRVELAPLFMIDDSEGLEQFLHAIRTMFLSMMATLERNDLLKPDSEVKNVGMIMSLLVRLGEFAEDFEGFDDLPKYIHAYAAKHNIVLRDLPEDSEPEDSVPATGKGSLPEPTAKKNDPWGFSAELKKLGKEQRLGGDHHDITTMSGPERKKAHFDGKDPLAGEGIKALKEGLVMQLA